MTLPAFRPRVGLACVLAAAALGLGWLLWPDGALAQSLSLNLGGGGADGTGGSMTSRVLQLLALLTVLSIAPSILIMVTCFTRIIIVLSFLRTAMGIQQVPPNTVLLSLALFLTFFIMQPVFQHCYDEGIKPLISEEIDEVEAFKRTIKPLHAFMVRQTSDHDIQLFMDISRTPPVKNRVDLPLQVVIPAFMISEMKRAFEIGFLLFLPFLIIDVVVGSILMAMGMMMLPPTMVSMPFKIIFFVIVDGWYLVVGSLAKSFGTYE